MVAIHANAFAHQEHFSALDQGVKAPAAQAPVTQQTATTASPIQTVTQNSEAPRQPVDTLAYDHEDYGDYSNDGDEYGDNYDAPEDEESDGGAWIQLAGGLAVAGSGIGLLLAPEPTLMTKPAGATLVILGATMVGTAASELGVFD